jgi:hypothetical protein
MEQRLRRCELREKGFAEIVLGVRGLFDQWVIIQISSPGVVLVAKCVRSSKIIGIGI